MKSDRNNVVDNHKIFEHENKEEKVQNCLIFEKYSGNCLKKNSLIIIEEVSTKQQIKGLEEQDNNSTHVKPKEIN